MQLRNLTNMHILCSYVAMQLQKLTDTLVLWQAMQLCCHAAVEINMHILRAKAESNAAMLPYSSRT